MEGRVSEGVKKLVLKDYEVGDTLGTGKINIKKIIYTIKK